MISIHALLAESDGDKDQVVKCLAHISIHALLAESDSETVPCRPDADISIHALLAESDLRKYPVILGNVISIHALLAESNSMSCWSSPRATIFLSTLSLRRATGYEQYCTHAREISIHALLAESDRLPAGGQLGAVYFYPRSPCGERPKIPPPGSRSRIFLSTLSLRRATACRSANMGCP